MIINVKKTHEDAVVPTYAKVGDAGLDLTAVSVVHEDDEQITYDTGLAFAIPDGYVGLVFPRSSIRNFDLILSNGVGVIDSGYRGTIQATFNKYPMYDATRVYAVNDRICQLVVVECPKVMLNLVDELDDTERGIGGFGSTGL
jgi:dUTP pyrophosphatase